MPLALSNVAGCLLGTMTGDSLGGRVEGAGLGLLRHRYPSEAALLELVPGRYGAPTEMTIATATSLARFPALNQADLAAEIARSATRGRRYGHGTQAAIERLREGEPWQSAAVAPGGRTSFGNGAAVRAAPIGLLYGHDAEQLRWIVEEAAGVTHRHALACEGAVLQAVAVALAVATGARPLAGPRFLLAIGAQAQLREFRSRYEAAARMVEREVDAGRVIDKLGNGRTALGSVVTAAFCFARQPDSFERAVAHALALGGDAVAIAAMTGAIAGARLGAARIPRRWRERLECDAVSPARVEELAASLFGAARSAR